MSDGYAMVLGGFTKISIRLSLETAWRIPLRYGFECISRWDLRVIIFKCWPNLHFEKKEQRKSAKTQKREDFSLETVQIRVYLRPIFQQK